MQQAAGKGAGRGECQRAVLWSWNSVLVEVGDLAAAGKHVGQIRPENVGLQAKIDDLVAGVAKLVIEVAGGGRGQCDRQHAPGKHLVDHATFAGKGKMEGLVPGACLETETCFGKESLGTLYCFESLNLKARPDVSSCLRGLVAQTALHMSPAVERPELRIRRILGSLSPWRSIGDALGSPIGLEVFPYPLTEVGVC